MAAPKAILFDIGGVCVKSPMQAIHDYEAAHGIPHNWVNFAIARSSERADGAWAKLERGQVPLDAAFFAAFSADLHSEQAWRQFNAQKPKKRSFKDVAFASQAAPSTPAVPKLDATTLFWAMMIISRTPEPAMAEALTVLRASRRFTLGALSNTVQFPSWHPLAADAKDGAPRADIFAAFDVFVSSAHAGVRKPHRDAYELALKELDQASRNAGRGPLAPHDVLFLDDIGQNLKAARDFGMRTIKVSLGRVDDAVKEMEGIVGMSLRRTDAKL